MAAPPRIDWRLLSDATKAILGWAVAIEVQQIVGTRGLLIGTMRAPSEPGEAEQLLRHFGVRNELLFGELRSARPGVPIAPDAARPARLEDVPTLTANAEEALSEAFVLAEENGSGSPVEPAHVFGGILAVTASTAYTALADVLAPRIELSLVADAYPEYLVGGKGASFAAFLEERFPNAQPQRAPAAAVDGPAELSPSVRRLGAVLTGPVNAATVVAQLISEHPEYGGGRGRKLQLDPTSGRAQPVNVWLEQVAELLAQPAPLLHGRLLIAALARLEPALGSELSVSGFLAELESEIREPLDELFVGAPPVQQAAAARTPPLTTATRHVLAYATAALTGARSAAGDDGTARAAVLFAALHYASEDRRPTVANRLLETVLRGATDPAPRLDGAAAALDVRRSLLVDAAGVTDDELEAGRLAPIVSRAEAIRTRTGSSAVHLRHLLSEALASAEPTMSTSMVTALGVGLPSLRQSLRSAIAEFVPEEPAEIWDAVLAEAPDTFDLAGGVSRDAVDPTRGIALEDDHLGVGTYVAMLAALIADGRTPEPLSIGLFGEWGSGKSYFMGLLREQVTQFSARGSPYCRDIRQIGFNAWHYADTNIWASLGDEIFEQLAGPGASVEEQRERLRSELHDRLQLRKELQAATVSAQEETTRLSKALEDASAERRTSAADLIHAAAQSATVKRQLDKAWRRIGVADTVEQGSLLGDEVRGTVAEIEPLRQAVRGGRGITLVLVAVLGVALVVVHLVAPTLSRWFARGGFVALAAVLPTVVFFVARVRSGLSALRAATGEINAALDKGDSEAFAARLDELRRAEANQRVLQAQHDQVVDRVGELGRELAELSPGNRLYRFVTERAGSDEYRQHLGLISTVRKDFEQLVDLLKAWRKEGDTAAVGIDRIVLYIDDLDRCSPRQVVEVLQAVHLLLALDLFVVVVGVDPRWLLRSLQSEYDRVLTSDHRAPDGPAAGETWQASPHDYLEKIFNIPFALPRMTPRGFETLVKSFTEVVPDIDAEERRNGPRVTEQPPHGSPVEGNGADPALADETGTEAPVAVEPLGAEQHSEAAAASAGAATVELRPLTRSELLLLESLAPLVETPREAKRLVNLYRLIRSTRNLRPASRFLGSESQPGEYEAVVILLGMLSGHGRLLEDVLSARPADGVGGGLMHRPSASSWQSFASGLCPVVGPEGWTNDVVGAVLDEDVARWQRLHDGLIQATSRVTLQDMEAFQFWAPRIARFSFLLSPYLGESADDLQRRSPALV